MLTHKRVAVSAAQWAVLMVVLTLATSCASTEAGGSKPPPSSEHARPASAGSGTAPGGFTELARWSDGDANGVATSTHAFVGLGAGTFELRDRRDGRRITSHQVPAKGWIVAKVMFGAGRAVVFDEDTDVASGSKGPGRIMVYDARTGAEVKVEAPPVSRFPYQAAQLGNVVYYTSGPGGAPQCLVELSLVTLQGQTVTCVPEGRLLLYVRPAEHGVTWVEVEGQSFDGCRTGYLRGSQSEVRRIEATPCRLFDTAEVGGWTVWSEIEEQGEGIFDKARLVARDRNGGTAELGLVNSGSVRQCGRWVYWLRDSTGMTEQQLLRWTPGSPPEVSHSVAGENLRMAPVECSGDLPSLNVKDVGNGTVLLLPPGR